VVENHHLVRSHDGRLANLVGIEPAEMDVRHDAILEVQAEEYDVLDALLNETLPADAHVGWLHLQHVENLRDVVRREAPQRILVAADPAQVHALSVDVENLAQIAI